MKIDKPTITVRITVEDAPDTYARFEATIPSLDSDAIAAGILRVLAAFGAQEEMVSKFADGVLAQIMHHNGPSN